MACQPKKLSVPLARLSADVAKEQVSAGRHAFVEQQYGSGLYDEPQLFQLKPFLFTAGQSGRQPNVKPRALCF